MPGFRDRSDRSDPIAEMNVIPLVDIVLVLLIIFMLTAPLLMRTLDVRLPRAQAAQTAQQERLMITITRDGLVYFDKYPVSMPQLEEYLRAQAPQWKDPAVYIQADADVNYERVVQVLDALRRYGITRIGLLTRPPEAEQGR